MTQPSVIEWVFIGLMGLIVVLYCVKSILTIIDKKKHPEKYKNKEKKERDKLDE